MTSMSPETNKLLDIYMDLRREHLTGDNRYHSDTPIEIELKLNDAWFAFYQAVGSYEHAIALYKKAKGLIV